jgi:hypothetical protein
MGMSLFGNSGDKNTTNTSNTWNTTDSYNQSYNETTALSGFNTTTSFGVASEPNAAGGVANLGPYLMAAALIFGGVYLLNRKG